jgi:ribosome modulation factor
MAGAEDPSPYLRGYHAALRTGEYEGAETTPECPYPTATAEREQWWSGFMDGTEDYIDWVGMVD